MQKGFPDKWQYLNKKLAYPYEYFYKTEYYKKPVDILQKEDFFSKLKNKCPEGNGITRTKKFSEVFDIKNGEELTKIYLKSDVILLADVFEKFVKVSTEKHVINALYSISLPVFTYHCALKDTDNKLQTLEDKALILLLENNIRGDISSVMGDRYVISDDNKKIILMDATNLYDHSMTQMLPYDEIEMWHGYPDLYMHKLEEKLITPFDSDSGYFVEVDLRYPDNTKEKTKIFPFCPENKGIPKDKHNEGMKRIKPKNYTKF